MVEGMAVIDGMCEELWTLAIPAGNQRSVSTAEVCVFWSIPSKLYLAEIRGRDNSAVQTAWPNEGASVIRVLVVHETRLVRSGLAALLRGEEDIDAIAACWTSAPGKAASFRPQVCVVDGDYAGSVQVMDHPGGPGCELLVLASACRPGTLRRAVAAKARGFVDKDAPPARLRHAINLVAEGQRYVDHTLTLDFLQAADMPLTARELSVLSLAAGGASVPEIARELHLSSGTVRNYMAAINRKTGARNRVDAIRISQGAGWV
ncbi:hypothetical protein T261_8103 [Streptomyces lydicus]|nr:hypothetical protein T261_8103 [Streptomyces lydicus]